nr:MAG TPA: hypothetical protein [Herelleviridae sp.]
MIAEAIYPKMKRLGIKYVTKIKVIEILQDFAKEDFTNPFEELARMKLQAQKLLKELEKEQ